VGIAGFKNDYFKGETHYVINSTVVNTRHCRISYHQTLSQTMSATPFRNIALLGVSSSIDLRHPALTFWQATGNLGSKILAALNNAGFTVTAIQRKESMNTADGAAKSLKVDLNSEADLTSAFKDQDVVVSAMPNPRLATDKIWMTAAVSAGVKRIVPSEFSTNLETELSRKLPIVKDKSKFASMSRSLARSLLSEYAKKTKNNSIYVYSAPMSERKMTTLAE